MFILCTGTKAVYNVDKVIRFCVDSMHEYGMEDDDRWAIVADATNNSSYFMAYFDTEDEANAVLIDMMNQMSKGGDWVLLNA